MLKLSDFDYNLPKELIAQYPLEKRDRSQLLVVSRKDNALNHKSFTDILDYLHPGDCLVLNDTKVLACRLKGKRVSAGKVEILLLKQKSGTFLLFLDTRSHFAPFGNITGQYHIHEGALTYVLR